MGDEGDELVVVLDLRALAATSETRAHLLAELASHVLVYVDSGTGRVAAGELEVAMEAGDVLLVEGRRQLVVSGDLAGAAIAFSDEAAPRALTRSHRLLSSGGVAEELAPLSVPEAERDAWRAGIRALQREVSERDARFRDAVQAHLVVLLVSRARLLRSSGRLAPDDPVATVLAFVDQHFRDPITVPQLARKVALSPRQLSRLVRQSTERTVTELIEERRLAEARELLRDSGRTIAEVARLSGYRDTSYFHRRFRRAYGLAPASWRERVT